MSYLRFYIIPLLALYSLNQYAHSNNRAHLVTSEIATSKEVFQFKLYADMDKEEAMISYYLEKTRKVHFKVLNAFGEIMTEKNMDEQTQGSYFLPVYLENIKSGIYYFLLEIDDYKLKKKLEVE